MSIATSQTPRAIASAAGADLPPFDPFVPGFGDDPYPAYARYLAAGSVHRGAASHLGAADSLYVFGFEEVTAALRDPRLGREAWRLLPPEQVPAPVPDTFGALAGEWMLFRDPPDHTRLRSLVSQAFTPRAVAALRPAIERIAAELLDASAEGDTADLIAAFAYPLPVQVIAHVLGVPPADRVAFRRWSMALARALDVDGVRDPAIAARSDDAARELVAYLRGIVAERRRRPQDDLITTLIDAEAEGSKLTESELLSSCVLLLLAGHETTVNLIGNGVLALLRHPAAWQRLLADPSLVANAVEELLRYDSPVQMTFRTALDDTAIGDTVVPPGESVAFVLGAANRDPARFPEPDRLDVGRTVGKVASFGMGIHFCLGAALARLEAEVAFAGLLSRFPDLRLASDRPAWRPGIVFHGLQSLPVAW